MQEGEKMGTRFIPVGDGAVIAISKLQNCVWNKESMRPLEATVLKGNAPSTLNVFHKPCAAVDGSTGLVFCFYLKLTKKMFVCF